MERRISMILAELAELRDGLGRVQEKDDQFVEEIKQLENLGNYPSGRRPSSRKISSVPSSRKLN